MPDRPRDAAAELGLLLVALIWGANYPVAKYALASLDPFIFNAVRFIVATAVVYLLSRARSSWTPVARGDWRTIGLASLVGNVLYQAAFIVGLNLTTAGNSAVLLSTSPLWTVLLGARMHRERVRPAVWTGMAVSLAGVVCIIIGSGRKFQLGGGELFGDVIMLAAAVLWAVNTNVQKPLLTRYSPAHLAFVMLALGTGGLTLIAIPPAASFQWSSAAWPVWLAAAASGALSIGIGNALWSRGVQRIGPGRTSNFSNLVPVVALASSWLTLHEELLPIQLIGAAVTIAGVWLARH